MILVLKWVFWTSLGLGLYVYFIYPAILALLAGLHGLFSKKVTVSTDGDYPVTALLIACFNEEKEIEDKIENAVSLNYPLSLLDDITAMVYYNLDNRDWYRFINWQRTYDSWRFHVIGFWNPDEFQICRDTPGTGYLAGKGVQFMVVFNH